VNVALLGGSVVDAEGVGAADIVVRNGRVDAVGPQMGVPSDAEVIDARGLLVAPGFWDLQVNGGYGIDLASEPERLWELAALLPRHGVTSFLPTIVTTSPDVVDRARAAVRAGPPPGFAGAAPAGLHLEGPMLSATRRGAHPAELLRSPTPALVQEWTRHGGVTMVTLAPELPGAPEVTRLLVDAGVVVAIGHTDASTDQVLVALDAGASYVTHLWNAMAPLIHREPGPVGVALADERLTVGLIADGIHVHPLVVAVAQRVLGRRLNLVTDAVAALGLPPGSQRFGTRQVTVDETGVRLDDGTLAGSALGLDQAVRNLVAFSGCALHEAVATVTTTPARLLGLQTKGSIRPGGDADLTLLTPDLEVAATLIAGRLVHDAREPAWRS
jgi:N-acetylglucosamine-6-phosphate deacetylase